MSQNKIKILLVAGVGGGGKTTFIENLKKGNLSQDIKQKLPKGCENWTSFSVDLVPSKTSITDITQYIIDKKGSSEGAVVSYASNLIFIFKQFRCWEYLLNGEAHKGFQKDKRLEFIKNADELTIVNVMTPPKQASKQYIERYKKIRLKERTLFRQLLWRYIKMPLLARIPQLAKNNKSYRQIHLHITPKLIQKLYDGWEVFVQNHKVINVRPDEPYDQQNPKFKIVK